MEGRLILLACYVPARGALVVFSFKIYLFCMNLKHVFPLCLDVNNDFFSGLVVLDVSFTLKKI